MVVEAYFHQLVAAAVAEEEEELLSRLVEEGAEVEEERQSSGEAAERCHEAEERAQVVTLQVGEEERPSLAPLAVKQVAHLLGPDVSGCCGRAVAVVVPDLWQGAEVGCSPLSDQRKVAVRQIYGHGNRPCLRLVS